MNALYDLTPFTLLDFPGMPAAIFWFAGCNLRCVYCYNPDIVLGEPRIDEDDALAFLAKRIGRLEGVVLSGGEATLYPNLIPFCRRIRELGYKIKLDTNAMRPDVIDALLNEALVDTIALDFKTLQPQMNTVCGGGSEARFWESFERVRTSGIPFEVRTTYHPDLMDEETISMMVHTLRQRGYDGAFYIQTVRSNIPTLGHIHPPCAPIDYTMLERYGIVRR